MLDAFLEVEFQFERIGLFRIVGFHLALFPDAERMGRMKVGNLERFGKPLSRNTGVPVMAVDEGIGEVVFLDEAQRVFAPFQQMAVEIFLRNKLFPAAGNADDADAIVHLIDFRLVLKAAGVKIDSIAELAEFLRKFEDIDNLSSGVGCAKRRVCGYIAMRRYECYPWIAFSFARGSHRVPSW